MASPRGDQAGSKPSTSLRSAPLARSSSQTSSAVRGSSKARGRPCGARRRRCGRRWRPDGATLRPAVGVSRRGAPPPATTSVVRPRGRVPARTAAIGHLATIAAQRCLAHLTSAWRRQRWPDRRSGCARRSRRKQARALQHDRHGRRTRERGGARRRRWRPSSEQERRSGLRRERARRLAIRPRETPLAALVGEHRRQRSGRCRPARGAGGDVSLAASRLTISHDRRRGDSVPASTRITPACPSRSSNTRHWPTRTRQPSDPAQLLQVNTRRVNSKPLQCSLDCRPFSRRHASQVTPSPG